MKKNTKKYLTNKILKIVNILLSFLIIFTSEIATAKVTKRIPEFSNSRVNVWKTIIYPTNKQKLKMHRHENDRIVVAITDGTLMISNNQGQNHLLNLKKGNSYYLTKDPLNELHTDENITKQPIEVVVIELKSKL